MATELDIVSRLTAEVRHSEPRTVRGVTFKWRLLDVLETQGARAAAQGRVYKDLLRETGDKDAALKLTESLIAMDSHTDYFNLYALAGAMCRDDEDGRRMFSSATDVGDAFSPMERQNLVEDYLAFADDCAPHLMSEEDEDAALDELKKNPDSISSQQLGSNTLRSLLTTSVRQLLELEAKLIWQEESQVVDAVTELAARVEALESQMNKSTDGG
jgi:hypothetical protein